MEAIILFIISVTFVAIIGYLILTFFMPNATPDDYDSVTYSQSGGIRYHKNEQHWTDLPGEILGGIIIIVTSALTLVIMLPVLLIGAIGSLFGDD